MALRPEHEILQLVSRRELRSESETKLRRLLENKIDWEYLQATARSHGLLPLLQKHAVTVGGDLIPNQYRLSLKQYSVMNSQSVLHLISKTLKVQRLFTEHDIEIAILKGPLLSQMAYGDLGLRQAGDIDVLIKRGDFELAKALLESLGYEMRPTLNKSQQASHLAFHCEIQFMRDDWFTVVDLHWGLTPRTFVFGLSGDEVLSRLQTVSFAGSQVQTFSLEDLVLYQAMHGAKHLWRRFELIGALSELIRSLDASNWSTLVDRTLQARGRRILALGLRLVENFFDEEVPREVFSSIDSDGQMGQFAQQVGKQILTGPQAAAQSADTNIYNLKIMDRKRDAVISTLRALFVPTLSDWQALSLPTSIHPLYYAVRPLRLSGAYGASLLRKLTHRTGH